jgi:hypothetical protein
VEFLGALGPVEVLVPMAVLEGLLEDLKKPMVTVCWQTV